MLRPKNIRKETPEEIAAQADSAFDNEEAPV